MSGFSDVDAAPDPAALVAYLDVTAHSLRLLKRQAMSQLDVRPGQRILDLGCGAGHNLVELADRGARAVGVDSSHTMIARARERLGARAGCVAVADASAIPLRDASFDGAYVERVFQHLSDLASAIGELGRVLRSGAKLVVLDTDWSSLTIEVGDPKTASAVRRGVTVEMVQPALGAALPRFLSARGFVEVSVQRAPVEMSMAGYDITDLDKAGSRAIAAGYTDVESLARWQRSATANDHPKAVHLDRLIVCARR